MPAGREPGTRPTKTRRVVNVVRRPEESEPFWPVACAMAVLGGFLVGSVLAYLQFDDPRWYANAWTWLLGVLLGLTAAGLWLCWVPRRRLRRAMQFAVVVGAIVHVLLFLVAKETAIFGRESADRLARSALRPPRREVVIPEYQEWQIQRDRASRRELEQPLESETPPPEPETKAVERQETEPPREPQPQAQATTEPHVTPLANAQRRPERESQPRQSDEPSQLSRQVATPALPASGAAEPLPAPKANPATADAAQPQTTPLNRSPAATSPARPEPQPAPESASVAAASAPRRAAADPAVPQPTAAPLPTRRRTTQPEQAAAASTSADRVATAISPLQPNPRPLDEVAARPQATASPQADARARDLNDSPALERTAPEVRRAAAEVAPDVARTPTPLPTRQPQLAAQAEVAAPRPAPAAMLRDAGAVAGTVEPRPSSIARQVTSPERPRDRSPVGQPAAVPPAPAPARIARRQDVLPRDVEAAVNPPTRSPMVRVADAAPIAAATPATAPSLAVAEAQPRATAAARQPASAATQPPDSPAAGLATTGDGRPQANAGARRSVSETGPTTDLARAVRSSPARTRRDANATAAPTAAESVQLAAEGQSVSASATQPTATALSKASAGTAGSGETQNLERAADATATPATTASAAAQRPRSVQNAPPGPALDPSAAAIVRSSRAVDERTAVSLAADPLADAQRRGDRQPTERDASAGATVSRAAADAAPSQVLAARGAADVDLGPTRRITGDGPGPAAGGGQPTLQPEFVRGTPRSPSGLAVPAATTAEALAEATQTPATAARGNAADSQLAPETALAARQGDPQATVDGNVGTGQEPMLTGEPAPAAVANRREGTLGAAAALGDLAPGSVQVPRQTGMSTPAGETRASTSELAGSASEPATASAAAPQEVGVARAASDSLARAGSTGKEPVGDATALLKRPEVRRTRVDEGLIGGPLAGGGTRLPTREVESAEFATPTRAETTGIAGAPASQPQNLGADRGARELAARRAAEAPQPGNAERLGNVDVDAPGPGTLVATPHTGPAARAELAQGSGDPAPRSVGRNAPDLAAAAGLVPDPVDLSELSPSELMPRGEAAPGASGLAVARRAAGGIVVDLEARDGPGGLASQLAAEAGIRDRRTRNDEVPVQVRTPRFLGRTPGGEPGLAAPAVVTADSFRRRVDRSAGRSEGGASPATEESIELGLLFLSRHQRADGSWTLRQFADRDGEPQLESDSAATALALLAFQGAGYHHLDYKYADAVAAGLDFLVRNQAGNGDLCVVSDETSNRVVRLYSHSIAALALSEAYGMTQDPELREPAERAVAFIVSSQHPERGGWRYSPRQSADTSVSGWMMMALKSSELAGLQVPPDTYQRINRWLDTAQQSPQVRHLYRYNPYAPDTASQRQGRAVTKTMTSVGLLMRLYLGWQRDNEHMLRGATYLAQNPPALGTTRDPQRDTYYWYYGTQVMYHMGGDHWKTWNDRLHPLLVGAQIKQGPEAGSWDPGGAIPDRWAPHAGRLYVTTMNLLSLEVAYRHLPLYEATAR